MLSSSPLCLNLLPRGRLSRSTVIALQVACYYLLFFRLQSSALTCLFLACRALISLLHEISLGLILYRVVKSFTRHIIALTYVMLKKTSIRLGTHTQPIPANKISVLLVYLHSTYILLMSDGHPKLHQVYSKHPPLWSLITIQKHGSSMQNPEIPCSL